jgi:hypothetical protein
MKWITGVTAVLTLTFAVLQLVRLVSDARDRQRQIAELTRVEKIQAQSGDYATAWSTLEQAVKIAESGGQLAKLTGQLSTDARELRAAQEDLAMAWLQNIRVDSGRKYSDVLDPIVPVMTRGASNATGVRKADLVAHIGWTSVYRELDGQSPPDPTPQYRAALGDDPSNPYAHAFLGFSMAKDRNPMDDVMKEFSAAVAANRARPFVRLIERAAFRRRGDDANAALVAVVNEMRRNSEAVPESVRSDLRRVYTFACGLRDDAGGMRALLAAAPAGEQAATFRAFFIDPEGKRSDAPPPRADQACLATLLEAAGQRGEALAVWRALRQSIGRDPSSLTPRADAAIRRLSGGPGT